MTTVHALFLDKTFGSHVFERCFLEDDYCRLSKLRGKYQALRISERVGFGLRVQSLEKRDRDGAAVKQGLVYPQLQVIFADLPPSLATEPDCQSFRVVADDLLDGPAYENVRNTPTSCSSQQPDAAENWPKVAASRFLLEPLF